ncbi:GAF domain-containing protein [Curtobacterium sp. 18060]|uniref:GAF domain-containing protein n=1 Tax=Curtobacterium sp. 18060 TaxID=2681408 RepID=UPI002E16D149
MLAGAASALALFLAGLPDWTDWRTFWVWVGIASFVVAGLLAAGIDEARKRETQAKQAEGADAQLAMTDAFQPILRRITVLAARPSDKRVEPYQKVVSAVLRAMPTLFPRSVDVRMVVYRVDSTRGRKKRLEVEDSSGRQKDTPRAFVTGEGGRGDAVFAWLEKHETKFVPDIEMESDPDWKGSGRGYRTFISASIWSGTDVLGMLTVDAPEPGDLDETDVAVMSTLAHCLAIAFEIRGR